MPTPTDDQRDFDDPADEGGPDPGHPAEGNPGASSGEVLSGRALRPDGVLGPRIQPDDPDSAPDADGDLQG